MRSSEEIIFYGNEVNGANAISTIIEMQPDVVVVDIGLPDMSGINIVKLLKPQFPHIQFLMCTVFDTDEKVFESIKCGASSYILKNSDRDEFIATIKGVYAGLSPMSGDIARRVIRMVQKATLPASQIKVTKREKEVLELLAKGHTYVEISDQLSITVKTLKGMIFKLYQKLHVDNRTEAVNKYLGRL